MIRIPEIRREIEKFLKKDYLKSEIKKIKAELKTMDIYQRIPEPTLKHLSQLEDQFGQLSKKISETQQTVDKEFNNAMKLIEKRKGEAQKKIVGLRDYAFEQRDVIEDRIREQIQAFSGKPVKAKRKASKKKTTKKKSKTAKKTKAKASSKKASAKKKTTKKKTKAKKKVAKKTTKKKTTRRK